MYLELAIFWKFYSSATVLYREFFLQNKVIDIKQTITDTHRHSYTSDTPHAPPTPLHQLANPYTLPQINNLTGCNMWAYRQSGQGTPEMNIA